MNRKRKHLVVTIIMMLALMFSTLTLPVSAESLSDHTSQLLPEFQVNMKNASVLGEGTSLSETIKTNRENSIKISKPEYSTKSAYFVNDDLFSYSNVLTTATPGDLYFFSVPDDRNIIFKLQSSNPNYRVDLLYVDWNTGTAYITPYGCTSGSNFIGHGLTAGDWALNITSSGTAGDTYRIDMNAAGPAGIASIEAITDTLNSVVWKYQNNDLYFNNTFIANTEQGNPQLSWERYFYFSSGGSYNSREHDIDDVRVSYITTRVNYSSNYASSNNAVLIVLDVDTLFTYFESQYVSGNPPYHYSSFVDTSGRVTPRRLGRDFEDMVNNPKILVYDLNTNKVIDFVSGLNYYYGRGIEPMPTVTYYN